MNKQERFKQGYDYLREIGLVHTQRNVSEKMQTSETNVSKALKGTDGYLTDRFLKRFNRAYGYMFNEEWLIFGLGEMLKSTNNYSPDKPQLPLLPIEAIAGVTTDDNQAVTLSQCELYTVPDFMQRGAQFLIRVSGDSMMPRYCNGDIVAVKRVEEITFFQWGKIYVLDTNQGALIKRVYEDTQNKDNIICHSENSEVFADFSMPKKAIRAMFVIAGVIHTE